MIHKVFIRIFNVCIHIKIIVVHTCRGSHVPFQPVKT